ncbi:MAG TPA: CDP-alcohol phosphatidyltransferase family protein [Micromonosporaceae bacterium]|nr:CDP-alcohol phosphatidyltransferase family protein [Micromonosporaceae bacterium]
MDGLYALKPWYASRLDGVCRALVRNRVPPALVSAGGVAFGAAAGGGLLLLPPGPVAATAVGAALAARLACANLDGGVARAAGRASRFGAVTNELADRIAELAALAGTLALAPAGLVAAAALAAASPSWVSLAGAAAGAPRLQGGPIGKTERCLILVAVAVTGWAVPLLVVLGTGSAVTALLRVARLRRVLGQS